MRSFRRALVASLATAAVLGVLAGCGGGSEPDRTKGLDASQILARSRVASEHLTAFRMKAATSLSARTTPGALPGGFGRLLAGAVRIDGEGPVDDGSMSFDFEATLPGVPALQGNITKVGPQLFVALLGVDYKVDAPPAKVAAITPSQIPAGLLSWAAEPKEVGREDVGGEPTVHLTATIDAGTAVEDLASLAGPFQSSPITPSDVRRSKAQLRSALTDRRMELWIGTADLIPRRITARVRFAGRVEAIRQLRTGSLDLDVGFTDIGKGTEITAPQTTETLDLNRLRSLFG